VTVIADGVPLRSPPGATHAALLPSVLSSLSACPLIAGNPGVTAGCHWLDPALHTSA
jgi:hypothetical protein